MTILSRQLVRDRQADVSTLYQYAFGKLVLWVAADSPLDVAHKSMDVLLDPVRGRWALRW